MQRKLKKKTLKVFPKARRTIDHFNRFTDWVRLPGSRKTTLALTPKRLAWTHFCFQIVTDSTWNLCLRLAPLKRDHALIFRVVQKYLFKFLQELREALTISNVYRRTGGRAQGADEAALCENITGCEQNQGDYSGWQEFLWMLWRTEDTRADKTGENVEQKMQLRLCRKPGRTGAAVFSARCYMSALSLWYWCSRFRPTLWMEAAVEASVLGVEKLTFISRPMLITLSLSCPSLKRHFSFCSHFSWAQLKDPSILMLAQKI